MTLVAPAYQQQLREEHDEGSLSSWCKITSNMRASSETSQHLHTARTAAAATPAPRQSPAFRRRRRPKLHTATQKKGLDAEARSTIPSTGSSTAHTSTDDCDGPLSFPAPKFSLAVKVASDEEGYILVSQTTGRRWVAISSARKCQFGEVLRAVELTEEISEQSPTHFAIKVPSKLLRLHGGGCCCLARGVSLVDGPGECREAGSVRRASLWLIFCSRDAVFQWRTGAQPEKAARDEGADIRGSSARSGRDAVPFHRRAPKHSQLR